MLYGCVDDIKHKMVDVVKEYYVITCQCVGFGWCSFALELFMDSRLVCIVMMGSVWEYCFTKCKSS